MLDFSWQVLVLFSGMMSGFSQIVGKKLVGKHGAVQTGFWREIGSVILVIIALIFGSNAWYFDRAMGVIIYGVVLSVSLSAYYAATRDDLTGTVVLSSSLGQILIMILSSIVFSEWIYFDPRNIRGVINLLAAIFGLVAFVVYQGGMKLRSMKWSKMFAVAVGVNVLGNLYVKYLVDGGMSGAVFLAYQSIGTISGSMILMKIRSQKYLIGRRAITGAMLQGLIASSSVLIYLYALSMAPLSLASLTRRVATILITAGAGLILFRERKKLDKKMGWGLVMGILVYGLVSAVN